MVLLLQVMLVRVPAAAAAAAGVVVLRRGRGGRGRPPEDLHLGVGLVPPLLGPRRARGLPVGRGGGLEVVGEGGHWDGGVDGHGGVGGGGGAGARGSSAREI